MLPTTITLCLCLLTVVSAETSWFKCKQHLPSSPISRSCSFGDITIRDASLTPTKNHDGLPSLKFSLTASLSKPIPGAQFTATMTAIEAGKSIQYGGHKGQGYDMCCNFAEDSTCQWLRNHETGFVEHVPVDCPLLVPQADLEQRQTPLVWTGSMVKPFHVMEKGLWELKFMMNDGEGRQIGQVTAWARVTNADLGIADGDELRLVVPE
eukprot:TRINITY_DN86825_c0_g1_i1.p1 TRINITY_DN86825_c0_g1~~TRINITY_DN86825_c0_g1_i1.p1  ORF type:complete len:209 (-),score=9.95 TRINITY_DN86825_c0_g1_i1:135-761(-)